MKCLVTVHPTADNRFTARSVAVPALVAEAATEGEALQTIRTSPGEWFRSGRLVQLDAPTIQDTNPWLTARGRSGDDPQFEQYSAAIERFRAETHE